MKQIARNGKTELGVAFVVAGVGEIVRFADFLEPGIFDTAVAFVFGFGREHGFRAAREVNAVLAFRIAEPRRAGGVLSAIEHHEFSGAC